MAIAARAPKKLLPSRSPSSRGVPLASAGRAHASSGALTDAWGVLSARDQPSPRAAAPNRARGRPADHALDTPRASPLVRRAGAGTARCQGRRRRGGAQCTIRRNYVKLADDLLAAHPAPDPAVEETAALSTE